MNATSIYSHRSAQAFSADEPLGAGELLDLADGRAVLRFPTGCFDRLPLGALVRLRFEGASGEGVDLDGHLVAWRVGVESELCHFDLVAEPAAIDALLAQRFDLRIFPDPRAPVPVTLRFEDESWTRGRLRDVGLGGLGVLVSLDVGERMPRRGSLRATFVLPGDAEPFSFHGELRHSTLLGQGVLLGLHFTDALQSTLPAEQARLRHWCRTRRRQVQDRLRAAQAG